MESQDAGAATAARAEVAEQCTSEIAERLTRLAGGQSSTPADLRAAMHRADEAQERAQASLDHGDRRSRAGRPQPRAHRGGARRGASPRSRGPGTAA
jgi:hypothetical protein